MFEWLSAALPYLLPTGSLGLVFAWIFKRDTLRAVAEKEKDDAHKIMYDNLKSSINDVQTDNKKLRGQVLRLEDLVFRATRCRYYDRCPLRIGLRAYRNQLEGAEHEAGSYGYSGGGQHLPRDSGDEPRGDSLGHGTDQPLDLEPP